MSINARDIHIYIYIWLRIFCSVHHFGPVHGPEHNMLVAGHGPDHNQLRVERVAWAARGCCATATQNPIRIAFAPIWLRLVRQDFLYYGDHFLY